MPDVQAFRFEDDGETPNNPRLPLVVYRAAVKLAGEHDPAAPFERAFARHGWGDGWRNGIYPFLHFHTATHEVLGIARGRATVEFGGAKGQALDGRGGRRRRAAGRHRPSAHLGERRSSGRRRLSAQRFIRPEAAGQVDHKKAVAAIAEVPLPEMDPVHGREGPLMTLWKGTVRRIGGDSPCVVNRPASM